MRRDGDDRFGRFGVRGATERRWEVRFCHVGGRVQLFVFGCGVVRSQTGIEIRICVRSANLPKLGQLFRKFHAGEAKGEWPTPVHWI